jgi:hypothetical protein
MNFIDTFRAIYPDLNATTHVNLNDKSERRIDQIWISPHKNVTTKSCNIEKAELITDSDYSIYTTTINVACFIPNNRSNSVYCKAQEKQGRRFIAHEKITTQVWSDFQDCLDTIILDSNLNDTVSTLSSQLNDESTCHQEAIDNAWNQIQNTVTKAINETLPFSNNERPIPFKRYKKKTLPERHTAKLITLWRNWNNNKRSRPIINNEEDRGR